MRNGIDRLHNSFALLVARAVSNKQLTITIDFSSYSLSIEVILIEVLMLPLFRSELATSDICVSKVYASYLGRNLCVCTYLLSIGEPQGLLLSFIT